MVPLVAFLVLAAWTWGKWPEALVDFGRELYVPWRLSEGRRLYEDVAYFNGPLSPWSNALLFRLFGVSLRTLSLANLAITAAVTSLIWGLVRLFGSRLAAAAACAVFLSIFAFGQFMPGGAYNFIAPYSHEMTHGTLLAAVALLLLARHLRKGGSWAVFACGVCLGLIALGKPEFTMATGVATAGGLALHHLLQGRPARRGLAVGGLFAAGALLPLLTAFALLLWGRSPAQALRDLSGPWAYVLDGRITQSRFYRDLRGTSDPGRSLGIIAVWTLGYAAALGPAVFLAFRRARAAVPVALSALCAGAVTLSAWRWGQWENSLRPLPVLLSVALILAGWRLPRSRDVLGFAFLLFAVLLPLKTWLNLRPVHYGFALALPATLAFLVLILETIPAWIARRGGRPAVFRAAACVVVALGVCIQLRATAGWLERKTELLGTGADTFLADRREARVGAVVDRVTRLRRPGETLVMLPEGAMIPYLTRTPSSTRYFQFMPPELAMYGEERIVAALDRRPPDWIVLLHRPLTEYGYRVLGDDYGLGIVAWAAERYAPLDRVLVTDGRGVQEEYALILRKIPGGR
ncbi:MAG TPA: hypothetical protein VFV75_05520 [Candidatus Polarisedimenticolaceae bacterium]|nr:hypothetical protein [Candidatus Polarisedimenticolaceae bacterium]